MFIDVLAVLLALSHVVTIGLILMWLGLKRPKSRKEFWARLKHELSSLSLRER